MPSSTSLRIATLLTMAGLAFSGCPTGATATPSAPPPDSSHALPFEPARDPAELFAPSKLNKSYTKDIRRLLRPDAARSRTDLEALERWADGADVRVPAEVDSSDIEVLGAGKPGSSTELTPEEKKALEPSQAGARVGIPSSVATGATLLGGIALLVKVLVEMLK